MLQGKDFLLQNKKKRCVLRKSILLLMVVALLKKDRITCSHFNLHACSYSTMVFLIVWFVAPFRDSSAPPRSAINFLFNQKEDNLFLQSTFCYTIKTPIVHTCLLP